MIKSANISACRKHRFDLKRIWDESLPPFIVIGLNPSTADETLDDPTIRRCIGFAKREGCGSLVMLNLFSYRTTDPKELYKFALLDLTDTRKNDQMVYEVCRDLHAKGGVIVCAWGINGSKFGQGARYRKGLREFATKCLGLTKDGHPRHPLYLKADAPLIPFGGTNV